MDFWDELIGSLQPDLIVDGLVIADPKVVTNFNEAHVAQMLGYLSITGLELAILLNFKDATLHWKRVIKDRKSEARDEIDFGEEF